MELRLDIGLSLRFILTGGERHDKTQALALFEGFDFDILIADKGNDYDDLLEIVARNDRQIYVPSSVNRRVQRENDWHLYRERHLVECFINKLKQFRGVFSRFDKLAKNYLRFCAIYEHTYLAQVKSNRTELKLAAIYQN